MSIHFMKRTERFFSFSCCFGESDTPSMHTNALVSLPFSGLLDVTAHQCLCWHLPNALQRHVVEYSGLRRRKRL